MTKEETITSILRVAQIVLPTSGRLMLFGSQARGDAKAGSDWDLLILLDKVKLERADYDSVAYPFRELGWEINEDINPVMYTKRQWNEYAFTPFYKNVERDKIVLV